MGGGADELERLVVKLVGDASDYNAVLKGAEKEIEDLVRAITNKANEATEAANNAMAEAARVTAAVATPVERYGAELKKLDDLLAAGHISQETYNRATERAYNLLPGVAARQDKLNQELAEASRVTAALMTPEERHAAKMAELDRLLKAGRISQETYNRALAQSPAAQAAAAAGAKALADAQAKYNAAVARGTALTQQLRTPTERYRDSLAELRTLHQQGHISQETYRRGVAALGKEFDKLPGQIQAGVGAAGNGLRQIGAAITGFGVAWTAGVTAPIAATAVAGVRAFGNLELAMAGVQGSANLTTAEMDKLEASAMSMSKELGIGPAKLVGIFGELVKAGVPLEEAIGKSGRAAAQFARVGELQAAQAAVILADSMTVFGEAAESTVNTLSSAADSSSSSIAQIAEAFSQVSAVAGSANQNLTDTSAALAILAANGVKGSDAGTSLKTMLLRLMAPVDKAKEVIDQYGLKLRDANGQMRPFAELVGELQSKLGGLDQETKDNALADLFGQDAIRAGQIFLKEGVAGFEDMKRVMSSALPVSQKYAILLDTLWGRVERLAAAGERFAVSIGGKLVGALDWLIARAEDLAAWWETLGDGTQTVVVWLAGLAAAAGPALVIIGGLVTLVGGLVTAVAGLVAIGWPAIAIAAAIVAGLALWAAEVVAVGAAIAGLVYYVVGPAGLAYAWTTATAAASDFFSKALGFVANFQTNIKILFDWLPTHWHEVVSDLGGLWVSWIANLGANALVGVRTLTRFFAAFAGWLSARFESVFNGDLLYWVAQGAIGVAKILGNLTLQAWRQLKAIFTGEKVDMSDFLGKLQGDFAKGAKDANLLGTLGGILKEEARNLQNPLAGFQSNITEAPQFVLDRAKAAGKAIGEEMAAGAVAGAKGGKPGAGPAVDPAAAAAKQAEAELAKSVGELTAKLEKQAATFGMSSAETEIYELAQKGATAEQLKAAKAAAALVQAKEKEKDALDKARELTERYASPLQKAAKAQADLKAMLDKGLISLETYNAALADADKELKKEHKATFSVSGIEALEAGSTAALIALEDYRARAGQSSSFAPQADALGAAAGAGGPRFAAGDVAAVAAVERFGETDKSDNKEIIANLETMVAGIETMVELSQEHTVITLEPANL